MVWVLALLSESVAFVFLVTVLVQARTKPELTARSDVSLSRLVAHVLAMALTASAAYADLSHSYEMASLVGAGALLVVVGEYVVKPRLRPIQRSAPER